MLLLVVVLLLQFRLQNNNNKNKGGRKNLRVDQESDLYRKTTTTKITFELGMTTGTKKKTTKQQRATDDVVPHKKSLFSIPPRCHNSEGDYH